MMSCCRPKRYLLTNNGRQERDDAQAAPRVKKEKKRKRPRKTNAGRKTPGRTRKDRRKSRQRVDEPESPLATEKQQERNQKENNLLERCDPYEKSLNRKVKPKS